MAEKRRFLDVWIVETNTVYKEVPYAVVTDWIQQGRLLENDMLKPSGTRDWFRLGGQPEFQPYLPRPEPNRTADQAEALEGVHIDFAYKRPHEDEDDDVDMIPLIDVSLVLLVFFMLTATATGITASVKVPEVESPLISPAENTLRIDISRDEDGQPIYAVGEGQKAPEPEERDLHTLNAVIDRLKVRLAKAPRPVEVVINADRTLRTKVVRETLLALRSPAIRDKIRISYFGAAVREP